MNETNTDQMNLEGNRPSNAKFALINGIYMGVALIIFSLVLYLLDVPRESPIQYLSYVITIALTIVFVIQWRDKHNDGFLTYGQAFSHGILIILFASILSAIYTFIFFQIIAPGEIENMLKEARESMYDNPAINDDNIDMAMSMTEIGRAHV